MIHRHCLCLIALAALSGTARSQGPAPAPKDTGPAPGHSHYGSAFDEGPRQKGYIMGGTGAVHFAVTSKSDEAKKFVCQGIGQLHGFWYLEAERSFRQAAALDPECAMAWWGLAMLHRNENARAKVFIQKAQACKAKVSAHEAAWIDVMAEFIQSVGRPDKDRYTAWLRGLDRIVRDYPDDIEAKAFLVWLHWEALGHGVPINSYEAVDALAKQIFAVEPNHPANHYIIHMWDNIKPARALQAAARCGIGSPGIAHMWHMPGHIYDKLQRWADAAWQQEASARVDHAYMIRDRVMPYSIHNYAHNQEWLCRDLMHLGRARDALAVARSLAEAPRHPKSNRVDGGGTVASYGRLRLLDVLTRFEMWNELLALSRTGVLDETDIPAEQVKWLRAVGRAHLATGDLKGGRAIISRLDAMIAKQRAAQKAAGKKAERSFTFRIDSYEAAKSELTGWLRLAEGKPKQAAELLSKARNVYPPQLAHVYLLAGNLEKAEQLARRDSENKVLPLATLVEVLAARGKKDEAAKLFTKLRTVAGHADPDLLMFGRLAPLAKELKLPTDWRTPAPPPADIGPRPNLDTLGPLRWSPPVAPQWALIDVNNKSVRLSDYRGRPVILVFHLGGGCPHCVAQLNKFAPLVGDFAKQGITVLAVSNDPPGSYASPDGSKPTLSLLSDTSMTVFKAYRCYDDFENLPLHGTFLIDGNGRIRWQDISFEPFQQPEFLFKEAKRLLSIPVQ